jgi:rubredoxin
LAAREIPLGLIRPALPRIPLAKEKRAQALQWHLACLRSCSVLVKIAIGLPLLWLPKKESPEGDPRMTYETTSNPLAMQAWKNLARNWLFACPLCGQMGIVITERLFWYSCRHCGYELASMKPHETVRNEGLSQREGLAQVQV